MDCIFCGPTTAPRAKEHVFPAWMLERYAWAGHYIQPTRMGTTGEILSQRTHVMGRMLAGGVCVDCNGKWMAELESENIEIVAALIDGTLGVPDVGTDARQSLARWLTKTAYVLHSCANWRRIVPAAHYLHLRNSPCTLPDGVAVMAKSVCPGDNVFFWQTTNWLMQTCGRPFTSDEARDIHDRGYKISLQIGGLVATIASCPIQDVHYCAVPQVHELLAPSDLECEWRHDDFEVPEAPQALAMASNFMLSIMRGWEDCASTS